MSLSRRTFLATTGAALAAPPLYAATGRSIAAPIRIQHNRLVLGLTIDGKGPFDFAIDTGAYANAIGPDLASDLKLKPNGYNGSRGIGGSVVAKSYRASEVIYGGVIRQPGVVFDAFHGVFDEGVSGLLAAGLLTARDSDLDFAAGEWRVYPEGRGDYTGYTPIDSDIRGGHTPGGSQKIFVTALLGDQRLKLLVDTGSPNEILLFPSGVSKTRLWTDDTPFVPVELRGIAGREKQLARMVRGQTLHVGPLQIDRPLVRLYDPAVTRIGEADGLIGLTAIYRLNLSTDVRGNRLWVQPNGLPQPKQRYRLSGMWLERIDADRARVMILSPKSPASEIGIKVGDILTGLPDFAPLSGEAGAKIEIGTPAGPRTLVLRDYL